ALLQFNVVVGEVEHNALVMIVNGDRNDLLRGFLGDDVLVKRALDLLRRGQLLELFKRRFLKLHLMVTLQPVETMLNAVITNIYSRQSVLLQRFALLEAFEQCSNGMLVP